MSLNLCFRHDPKLASQFHFQALELINNTDIHRPMKHDLTKAPFTVGQNVFTLEDLKGLIAELNQRASSGRRNRNHEWTKKKSPRQAREYVARKNVPLTQVHIVKIIISCIYQCIDQFLGNNDKNQ